MWAILVLFAGFVSMTGIATCQQQFPVDPDLGDMFMSLIEALTHFEKYGYLNLSPAKVGDLEPETIRTAITNYQTFYGLSVTNVVDNATLTHLQKPRCGCRDPIERMVGEWNPDDLRYGSVEGKWTKNHLTYRVSRIPSVLEKRDVRRLVRKAFKLWSETTSLTFAEAKKSDDVDIAIQFASKFHNGPQNFYNKMGDIAHAFPPVPIEAYSHLAGNIHLDAQEDWTVEGGDGKTTFNLLPVMLHEIGHALGLSHSTNPQSIMTPIITELHQGGQKTGLSQDDVDGIQSIYGPRMMANIVSQECMSVKAPYDAIANLFGDIYVFKGDRYWRVTAPGVVATSPGKEGALISAKWRGAPSNVDAVYQSTRSWNVVFIKGDSFWVYASVENHPLLPGYPKPLRLLTLPDGLNAAVNAGDKTYFVKRRLVWETEEDVSEIGSDQPQINEYTRWRKLPERIDAAFYYDGRIYFVKGDGYHYVAVNGRHVQTDDGASFRAYFLGCHV